MGTDKIKKAKRKRQADMATYKKNMIKYCLCKLKPLLTLLLYKSTEGACTHSSLSYYKKLGIPDVDDLFLNYQKCHVQSFNIQDKNEKWLQPTLCPLIPPSCSECLVLTNTPSKM